MLILRLAVRPIGWTCFSTLMIKRLIKGPLDEIGNRFEGTKRNTFSLVNLTRFANWSINGDSSRTLCSHEYEKSMNDVRSIHSLLDWTFGEDHCKKAYESYINDTTY